MRTHHASPAARGASRRGFTLVELLLAIIVFSIGVLGLAGTAAIVSRQMNSAQYQALAATRAVARLDSLASVSCTMLTDGTSTNRGVSEAWRVTRFPNAAPFITADVTNTVTWTFRGRTRSQVYTTRVAC